MNTVSGNQSARLPARPPVGYACVECYFAAHDPECSSEFVEHDDVSLTDWVCRECMEWSDEEMDGSGNICTACENARVEYGTTVGGKCDLGDHLIDGYWEYHTFIDHSAEG